jgi:hypothetical protein
MRPPLRLDSEPTSGAILGKFFTGKRLKSHVLENPDRLKTGGAMQSDGCHIVRIANGSDHLTLVHRFASANEVAQ